MISTVRFLIFLICRLGRLAARFLANDDWKPTAYTELFRTLFERATSEDGFTLNSLIGSNGLAKQRLMDTVGLSQSDLDSILETRLSLPQVQEIF